MHSGRSSRWFAAATSGEEGSGQRQKAEEEGARGEKEQAAGGDGNGGGEGEGEKSGSGLVGEARAQVGSGGGGSSNCSQGSKGGGGGQVVGAQRRSGNAASSGGSSAGAGDPRPHPLLLPWQPSCRRQEAPTAGTVAQPSSARALPRPPTGPLLPPPQAPVAAQDFPRGKSWGLGGSRPHPGRAGAAAWQAPPRCARGRRQYLHRATM